MTEFIFDITTPLIFNWTGKFESPTPEWTHLRRTLYDYELIIVTKGTLYIAADDQKFTIKKGSYLILPPLVLQYGFQPSSCHFYWMHFAQNEGEVVFPDPAAIESDTYQCANGQTRYRYMRLPQTGKLPMSERLIILLKQLQDAERRYHNKSYNDFCVTAILWEIFCQQKLSPDSSEITAAPASISKNKGISKRNKEQLYTDILDYVSWHMGEAVSVEQIAAYYGYNPRYLTTLFKEFSGTPLKSYIIIKKIELAKALLADTNDPISQIAYSIGFQDNHNFSSCFKKNTGLTPTEYRNSFGKRLLFHE
jgi:AraC-like DNA-binding protein